MSNSNISPLIAEELASKDRLIAELTRTCELQKEQILSLQEQVLLQQELLL